MWKAKEHLNRLSSTTAGSFGHSEEEESESIGVELSSDLGQESTTDEPDDDDIMRSMSKCVSLVVLTLYVVVPRACPTNMLKARQRRCVRFTLRCLSSMLVTTTNSRWSLGTRSEYGPFLTALLM